ncbi:MAG: peroxiredoxin family protein [bacterium]
MRTVDRSKAERRAERRETRVQRREARRRATRRRDRLFWGAIALVVVIGVAGLVYVARADRAAKSRFEVSAGDSAPEFTLPAVNGGMVSLAQIRQRTQVLLFFNEGIMCQPCWDQLNAIQRDYAQFRELGIEVVGITVDPVDQLALKGQQEGITLPVLADEGARVSRMYDTLRFGSMHPGERPGHTFILVGRDGLVRWRRDFREMYVPNEPLLQSLRALR